MTTLSPSLIHLKVQGRRPLRRFVQARRLVAQELFPKLVTHFEQQCPELRRFTVIGMSKKLKWKKEGKSIVVPKPVTDLSDQYPVGLSLVLLSHGH